MPQLPPALMQVLDLVRSSDWHPAVPYAVLLAFLLFLLIVSRARQPTDSKDLKQPVVMPAIGRTSWFLRPFKRYRVPISVDGVTIESEHQHVGIVSITGGHKSSLLASLVHSSPRLIAISGGLTEPLVNAVEAEGGHVWMPHGSLGLDLFSGTPDQLAQDWESIFPKTDADTGVYRSLFRKAVRDMAITYDQEARPRGIRLLRDALDAAAGTGRLGEGMREGWAGRVLDLVDSLGESIGHDVNVADCLLAGIPMLYCLDGFDDPGMSPLFASVILRQVVRATNVPKAQRGFARVMVDELALFGPKQLAEAMRVWRGRRVQFIGASQLASDFPKEIRGHINVWFLGQQSGGEEPGRRWASDVTFGLIPPENFGEHGMPRGTYHLVANGRTQQVRVRYWQSRPPAPSLPLLLPALPAYESAPIALPASTAGTPAVTPRGVAGSAAVSMIDIGPRMVVGSQSVTPPLEKPSVADPPSWIRAQGERGAQAWARLWHAGDPNVCWTCELSTNGEGGYAKLSVGHATNGAHRVIAEWFVRAEGRELKPWLTLDHQCHQGRNKRCVNPSHLEEVTREANKERSVAVQMGRPISYGSSIAGTTGGQHCACDFLPVVEAIEHQLEEQRQVRAARSATRSGNGKVLRLPANRARAAREGAGR
jgi:hypothetical protein